MWQELHDFLAATQDPEDRFFYVNQLSRAIGHRPEWVDEWRAARPGSALPALFSGALYVRSAWEARGALRGKYVAQDAARLFISGRSLPIVTWQRPPSSIGGIRLRMRSRYGLLWAFLSASPSCTGGSRRLTAAIHGIAAPTGR